MLRKSYLRGYVLGKPTLGSSFAVGGRSSQDTDKFLERFKKIERTIDALRVMEMLSAFWRLNDSHPERFQLDACEA